MGVRLNHTIVYCRDKERSAAFLTDVVGLPAATPFGPFLVVELDNDVSMDFHDVDETVVETIQSQHYAFLISEEQFDAAFARIEERGLEYWADPALRRAGEINRSDGGRGVYFRDLDGHLLEMITRPYGSGA